jgi:hypothetical protein
MDITATRALYEAATGPDPACCNACATFLLMVERGVLPENLVRFMAETGIEPSRPVEVWGAPEGGFLQVWWEFVGEVQGHRADDDDCSYEVEPGIRCAVTTNHPRSDWAVARKLALPALEITWEHDRIRYIEGEAWPEFLHPEDSDDGGT